MTQQDDPTRMGLRCRISQVKDPVLLGQTISSLYENFITEIKSQGWTPDNDMPAELNIVLHVRRATSCSPHAWYDGDPTLFVQNKHRCLVCGEIGLKL